MIRLELPFPPSVNAWVRPLVRKGAKHATIIKTQEQRDYINSVIVAVRQNTKFYSAGHLCYHLSLYFPDKRIRDGSNYLKAIEDSLNGRVWKDDSQIKARVIRDIDSTRPSEGKAVLWVGEMSEWRSLLGIAEGVDIE